MSKLTKKEMAAHLSISPQTFNKFLSELGMAVLQNEAERMQHRDAWEQSHTEEVFYFDPSIEHFKKAYENLK